MLRAELAGEGSAVAYVFGPVSPAVSRVWTEPHPIFLALKSKGLPIVYDLGGSEALIAQGKWYRLLLKGEEILHLALCDKVIMVDTSLMKEFPRAITGKSVLIPNCVDTALFQPKPGLDDGRTVTFVGRLTWERGVELFLDAVELIDRPVAQFIVAGDGSLRPKLEARVKQKALPVTFLGEVRHTELPELYNRSTVVVNPMMIEGIGNITLEAMSCGRCVVKSTGRDGDPIINDRVDGVLFRIGDQMELADRIQWALDHPDHRNDIGKAARSKVLGGYTPEIEAGRVAAVIRNIKELSETPIGKRDFLSLS